METTHQTRVTETRALRRCSGNRPHRYRLVVWTTRPLYLFESFGDRCCEPREDRCGADPRADNDPPIGAHQVDQIRNDPLDLEEFHNLTASLGPTSTRHHPLSRAAGSHRKEPPLVGSSPCWDQAITSTDKRTASTPERLRRAPLPCDPHRQEADELNPGRFTGRLLGRLIRPTCESFGGRPAPQRYSR